MLRLALLGLLAAVPANAEVAAEKTGQIEQLPQPFSPHWVWVSDLVLERAALMDLDEGRFLGMINGGYGTIMPLFPSRRPEIYVPATYYSRRSRGERTDVLEIYDAPTLSFVAEIALPARRATNAVALAHATLSDDDRFAAVFNWTTGTSLSIVDVERRAFTQEIALPGCSLVYAAGPRRFFSICSDGSLFAVTLNDDGREIARVRSQPFFDPRADPLTEKAVRAGNQWLFVSFDGRIHPIDVSAPDIGFGEPWSLFSTDERIDTWRVGGAQHLAVHEGLGRLYALVHRGGPDSHKQEGEEVWVYDLATKRRIERIKLVNSGLTIYGFPLELDQSWSESLRRAADWALGTFAPAAVGFIQVTQDDAPLLVTASQFSGSLGVYDARTGQFLRRVQPTGWTSDVLLAPWGGPSGS